MYGEINKNNIFVNMESIEEFKGEVLKFFWLILYYKGKEYWKWYFVFFEDFY